MIGNDIKYPVPFYAESSMPACAVMEANGVTTRHGHVCVKARAYQAGPPPKVLLINGPSAVSANSYGSASMASMGIVRAAGSVNAGSICGPTNNSTSLSSGYPGFVCVGAGAGSTSYVVRQEEATICRGQATANVTVNTTTFNCDNVVCLSGLVPVANSNSTLTVGNVFGDYICDNANITFAYSAANSAFQTIAKLPIEIYKGTLSANLAQGSTANANMTGLGTASVSDYLMKANATAIASGKKIIAARFGDTLTVTEAECP